MVAGVAASVLAYWAVCVGLLGESVVGLSPNNPHDIACQTKTGDERRAILKGEEYNAQEQT
jgi:hypothetical protein